MSREEGFHPPARRELPREESEDEVEGRVEDGETRAAHEPIDAEVEDTETETVPEPETEAHTHGTLGDTDESAPGTLAVSERTNQEPETPEHGHTGGEEEPPRGSGDGAGSGGGNVPPHATEPAKIGGGGEPSGSTHHHAHGHGNSLFRHIFGVVGLAWHFIVLMGKGFAKHFNLKGGGGGGGGW